MSIPFYVYDQLTKAKIFCKKFGSNPRFILAPQSFTEITLSMQPGHSGILERFAVTSSVFIYCNIKFIFV